MWCGRMTIHSIAAGHQDPDGQGVLLGGRDPVRADRPFFSVRGHVRCFSELDAPIVLGLLDHLETERRC